MLSWDKFWVRWAVLSAIVALGAAAFCLTVATILWVDRVYGSLVSLTVVGIAGSVALGALIAWSPYRD